MNNALFSIESLFQLNNGDFTIDTSVFTQIHRPRDYNSNTAFRYAFITDHDDIGWLPAKGNEVEFWHPVGESNTFVEIYATTQSQGICQKICSKAKDLPNNSAFVISWKHRGRFFDNSIVNNEYFNNSYYAFLTPRKLKEDELVNISTNIHKKDRYKTITSYEHSEVKAGVWTASSLIFKREYFDAEDEIWLYFFPKEEGVNITCGTLIDDVAIEKIELDKIVDLQIDYNNDGVINNADDLIENDMPGKLLYVNHLNFNNDGIPDFADGFDVSLDVTQANANVSAKFTPLKLRIVNELIDYSKAKVRFTYLESSPKLITRTGDGTNINPYYYPLPAGNLRIWLKNGDVQRSIENDFIANETSYDLSKFGITGSNTSETILFIEAINPSKESGDLKIQVEIDFDGNGTFDTQDVVTVTAVQMLFELINNEELPVVNSYGIAIGAEEKYKIDIMPSNLPDELITWEVNNDNCSFVGNNKNGAIIKLKGNKAGQFKLEVSLKGLNNIKPFMDGEVFEETTTQITLYIVCDKYNKETDEFIGGPKIIIGKDDDENNIEELFTKEIFEKMLVDVNKIYQQVGMKFELNEVIPIPRKEFLRIPTDDKWETYYKLQSYGKNTGGLEIYYVFELGGDVAGGPIINAISNRESEGYVGITMSLVNTNANTLAHEIGHACGLNDIYAKLDRYTILENIKVQRNIVFNDWSGGSETGKGTGFYNRKLSQESLIKSLLMYSVISQDNVDISAGFVFGLNKNLKYQHIRVGIKFMNNNPKHW